MLDLTGSPLSFAAAACALADQAEHVADALLGEPSLVSRHERRWGSRGSLSLRCSGPKRGFWFDHERGEGGDLLSLIARERSVRLSDALAIAYEMLGGVVVPPVARPKAIARDDDALARTAHAVGLWQEATPLNGTLGERYLIEHRRLDVTDLRLDHALRWHGRIGALVALMTDPASGEPIGIHRTFLNDDGTKRERKMLGRQGAVRLSPDDMISSGLGITEGIEDGLAVLLSSWSPVWAATSAGAIARLPVLSGIETLTIFADADDPGLQAAQTCSARWRDASREVSIASPRLA